jgi:5-methylcytosine-specific restriction protein A
MSGGWAGSDRKSRLPADWQQLRAAVRERSGGRCEVIKRNGKRCYDAATDCDHIIPGDDHSLANLRDICTWHHRRKSSREGNEAQAALRAMLRHPVEQHPGVITGPPRPPIHKGF